MQFCILLKRKIQTAFFHEIIDFRMSSEKICCIHLFFKTFLYFIYIGVSIAIRIMGNTYGLIHSVEEFRH